MKQVSLRTFQLNANTFLKDLPIVLTRYNLPVAVVNPVGEITQDKPNEVSGPPHPVEGKEVAEGPPAIFEPPARVPPVFFGRCNYCSRTAAGEFEVKIYNTEVGEFDERMIPLCEIHLKKARAEGSVKEGGDS